MNKKSQTQPDKSVADIARETFRLLGSRRAAPTPDAYRSAFYEVAGITDPEKERQKKQLTEKETNQSASHDSREYSEAIIILEDFAQQLSHLHDEVADYGHQLLTSIRKKDFKKYELLLTELVNTFLEPEVKQPSKQGMPALVDPDPAPAPFKSRDIPLVDPEPEKTQSVDKRVLVETDKKLAEHLRDLLVQLLSFGMSTLLHDEPELSSEAESLGETLKSVHDEKELGKISSRLKQLCFKIEMKGASSAEQQELLLRLFRLLLNNIGELLDDDGWLKNQIEVMQELISGPINYRALEDTESNLKEVIYKQGILKHSLNEAKESIKQMMINFIERLGYMAESTGNYHDRIQDLSQKISKTDNVIELNQILEKIMYETNAIQTDTLVSLNQMQTTSKRVKEAESKVRDLENQLEQMSELVREDKLTGSLNRRGLEDAFEREIARAERNDTSLCVSLLDLDNFKTLNDIHGHLAGDDALIHLVRIIKRTIRPTDIIARYGGEEFVILFPETLLKDAIFTMQRLQRELTKHFFMHNNERILITFSAGVALRQQGEDWDSLTHRADKAMYAAKQAGKNRVLSAE